MSTSSDITIPALRLLLENTALITQKTIWDWWPIIGPLLGVLIGGIISFGAQYYLHRQQLKEKTVQTETAFFMEIYSILQLGEIRKLVSMYDETLKFIYKHHKYPKGGVFLHMQYDEYFLVHRTHIQALGLLEPSTVKLIVSFYNYVFSLLEVATVIPEAISRKAKTESECTGNNFDYLFLLHLTNTLKRDCILCHKMVATGKEICSHLSSKLHLEYDPLFKDLPSAEEIEKKIEKEYPEYKPLLWKRKLVSKRAF